MQSFEKWEIRVYILLVSGGIGMSALARYFLHEGYAVGGYDRTESALTRQLVEEGAQIHYEDNVDLIGEVVLDPTSYE